MRALAVAALAVLVALAAAELLLSLCYPVPYLKPPGPVPPDTQAALLHRASELSGLAYELVPGSELSYKGVEVRTNRHGMRGEEPEPDQPGLIRIAVLGDSWTFGFAVDEESVYPRELERMLDESAAGSGTHFDVLNFGVSGYSTRDEVAVLEQAVPRWRPALVIVGYTLNDPENEPIQPLQIHFQETRWWQHLVVARLVAHALRIARVSRYGDGSYARSLHLDPRSWEPQLRDFDRMGRISAAAGIPVLLAIFPELWKEGWDSYPYGDLHARVAEAAGAAGLEVVDLLPYYTAHPARLLRVAEHDGHPNARGHEVAARALYDYVIRTRTVRP